MTDECIHFPFMQHVNRHIFICVSCGEIFNEYEIWVNKNLNHHKTESNPECKLCVG